MENNGPGRLVDGPCAGRDVRARLGHILVWWVGGGDSRKGIHFEWICAAGGRGQVGGAKHSTESLFEQFSDGRHQ